uniref:Serpentine receptor class gamma n=1 Tax=Strongyloides papillosus TaxID=174720 RepID=A0A0N5BJI6_STREA
MVDIIIATNMIQFIYKIPAIFLMILSVFVILKEIRRKNVRFNKQFYAIIVCKMVNDICYMITYYTLYKIPQYGFFNEFFKENDYIATLFYVLAALHTTFMFLITLLISINRYVAVKYPTKYEQYFSKSNRIKIIIFFIILSTFIGLGTIPFKAVYRIFNFADLFIPYFRSKNVIYYQIFYTIVLYGTISIATCIFNIKAILELKKLKKISKNYKKEARYIIYSVFVFITLATIEVFYVLRLISAQYEISSIRYIIHFCIVIGFDLISVGDYYFLIFTR